MPEARLLLYFITILLHVCFYIIWFLGKQCCSNLTNLFVCLVLDHMRGAPDLFLGLCSGSNPARLRELLMVLGIKLSSITCQEKYSTHWINSELLIPQIFILVFITWRPLSCALSQNLLSKVLGLVHNITVVSTWDIKTDFGFWNLVFIEKTSCQLVAISRKSIGFSYFGNKECKSA